jgi:hypothetical protein
MLSTICKKYLKSGVASNKYGTEIATAIDTSTAAANITETITNGVTDKAPSENAVYDALALKANLVSPGFTTPVLGVATATSINGVTPTAVVTGFTLAGGGTSKTLTVDTDITISNLAPKVSPVLTTPTLGVATATSVNGVIPTSEATGFTLAGGTISKTLTVDTDITISNLAPKASPSFTTPTLGVATATSVNALTLTSAATGFTVAGGATSKTLTMDTTIAVSALAPKVSPSFTTPTLGVATATSINGVTLVAATQAQTSATGEISISGMTTNGVIIVTGGEAIAGGFGYVVAGSGKATFYDAAGAGINAKKINYLVISK